MDQGGFTGEDWDTAWPTVPTPGTLHHFLLYKCEPMKMSILSPKLRPCGYNLLAVSKKAPSENSVGPPHMG